MKAEQGNDCYMAWACSLNARDNRVCLFLPTLNVLYANLLNRYLGGTTMLARPPPRRCSCTYSFSSGPSTQTSRPGRKTNWNELSAQQATVARRDSGACMLASGDLRGESLCNRVVASSSSIEGASPDTFNPNRYLQHPLGLKGGFHVSSEGQEYKRFNSLIFGFGRRVCVRQRLATNSITFNTARMLWNFPSSDSIKASDGLRADLSYVLSVCRDVNGLY